MFNKTDIDVMMLFKFDFNHAILNFKKIGSKEFSFELNLILIWSRDYVLFKCNVKDNYQKNLKKFSSWGWIECQFPSIDQMFLSIDQIGIKNRSSHLESFVVNFFIFLNDWEFLSIDRSWIGNQSSHWETSKCIY